MKPSKPPGIEVLYDKFPQLRRRSSRLLALLIGASAFTVAALFFWYFDRLFLWGPLVSQLTAGAVLMILLGRMIRRRHVLKACYGESAYPRAMWRFVIPAMPLVPAMLLHIAFVSAERTVPLVWASPVAAYFLFTGGLLFVRALWTFGVDNMALIYVYWPDEARLVESRVYSVLRHPTYSGAIRISFAFGLLNGSLMALILAAVGWVVLTLWLRFGEEPELLERFGSAYGDYQRQVPAFWVRPGDFTTFLRSLILPEGPL
jgi:protein-S-isoprenylcysteine O-methyltransferase Ste14